MAPSNATFTGAPESRSLTPDRSPVQRRQKIAEREARFDRFVMPYETAIGAETARDRGPRKLKFHAVEPFGDILTGLLSVDDDRAVVDADLGE